MQLKTTHATFTGIDPVSIHNIAERLRGISFGMNSEVHVTGADVDNNTLSVEIITRKEREVPMFDEDKGVLIREMQFKYSSLFFTLNMDTNIAQTYGGARDFAVLADVCKAAGCELMIEPLCIDLKAWSDALLEAQNTAQFAGCVIQKHYSDNLIGQFNAKSIDNRLHDDMLTGQTVKSMKFSYYHYDVRVAVEVRNDATITVSCSDDESLDQMHREHVALMLSNVIKAGE